MVGIQGLGGIPEPIPEKPSKIRSDKSTEIRNAQPATGSVENKSDAVVISSEAQAAAEVVRIVQMSKAQEQIRPDKVEQARQSIERGDYRKPEVVQKIAERILKLIK